MSTVLIWQTTSTGFADTERLGQLLAQNLAGGEVLELRGDLGAGKTTFVRGLGRGLKSADRVSSPTFTLNQIYRAGGLSLHHYDFYRLDKPGVIADQLAESLSDPKAITVVEWGRLVKNVLPAKRFIIELKPTAVSADERLVSISYPETEAQQIEKLENQWGSR